MTKKKAPLSTAQKKRKVDRQRERRNERKAQLIVLGVPNPSKYYNSEKAFKQAVEQRKKEIKREQKRQAEKQRQERNIETLKEKGVNSEYINSLKRKSKQFIDFIDEQTTPEYFKPKETLKKTNSPKDIISIAPETILVSWWDKLNETDMRTVVRSYYDLTNGGLALSIQNNVEMCKTGSPYHGGRLDFGIYDEQDYNGLKMWYMTTGASTESLQTFNLHQLLTLLATTSYLMNRDQLQQFIAWSNDIRNNIVPNSWREFIPLLEEYEEVVQIKPKKKKRKK